MYLGLIQNYVLVTSAFFSVLYSILQEVCNAIDIVLGPLLLPITSNLVTDQYYKQIDSKLQYDLKTKLFHVLIGIKDDSIFLLSRNTLGHQLLH